MELREALIDQVEYALKFKTFTLYFTLRNPTNKEDLEYRRRSGQIKAKGGRVESSDAALNAPLWLLSQITTKREYSNGSAERFPIPDEDYEKIPERTKLAVISKHLAELEGDEADLTKNS